jgi:hypothetical protein
METPSTSLSESALDHNNNLDGGHPTLPARAEFNSEDEHEYSNEVED